MNEYRLKVFERYAKEMEIEIGKLQEVLLEKPVTEFLKVQKEFAQLLEDNKGESRFTKEFGEKIDALHEREKKARLDIKKDSFENRLKVQDRLIELNQELSAVRNELNFLRRSI